MAGKAGRCGEVVWDPHPSRAGLLEEIRWAFIVPYPAEWVNQKAINDECVCPACKPGYRCRQPGEPVDRRRELGVSP